MQHYTFAVNAFVELVKQYGMDAYEFEVHETKTYEVIENVRNHKSEICILYLNDFNKKVLHKLFAEYGLQFEPLLECGVYVYMWKGHPLAERQGFCGERGDPCGDIFRRCGQSSGDPCAQTGKWKIKERRSWHYFLTPATDICLRYCLTMIKQKLNMPLRVMGQSLTTWKEQDHG